jgi:hypothetical protein
VLVESWGDERAFTALSRTFAGDAAFADASAPPSVAVYRLQNTRAGK